MFVSLILLAHQCYGAGRLTRMTGECVYREVPNRFNVARANRVRLPGNYCPFERRSQAKKRDRERGRSSNHGFDQAITLSVTVSDASRV